jgi:putative transposase
MSKSGARAYIRSSRQGTLTMTWTPEHRRRYAPVMDHVVRSNAIVRLAATIDAIDPPARIGRPRLWSTLVMLQALWWLCRAGSAWKLLPGLYPPRQTIGSRLERWLRLEVLERALAVLNGCLRLARGRKRRPSAGILDTQSVRTGPQAGPRGYDAGKKVNGRKRVLLVDTEGLVQAIQVVPASVQDRDTPAVIEPELAGSSLRKVWADLAFNGEAAAASMARCGIDLELVGRKNKTGFEVEPRRWRVEQTFGVLARYRRLLVDHEGSTAMSRFMTLLAALFTTANRFERQVMA